MARSFLAATAALVLVGCNGMGVSPANGGGASGGNQAAVVNASVRVRWTASSDPDVVGYRIYRGTIADFPLAGAPFVDAGVSATSVLVADVPKGTAFFKIAARGTLTNADGSSTYSAPVQVQVSVN